MRPIVAESPVEARLRAGKVYRYNPFAKGISLLSRKGKLMVERKD